MTKTERNNVIISLLRDDIDTMSSGDADSYIEDIMRDGFKGYKNFSDAELMAEVKERLGL